MTYPLVEQLLEQYMSDETAFAHRWHYIEGCILKAYLDNYERTGNDSYYQFVKRYIDGLYHDQDHIPEINPAYYNIDQIRMASILFTLYAKETDDKYKRVLDLLFEQLKTYPRTESGSFWHKVNYPNQIWLDGLYMGQPFYVRYIKEFAESKDYSDTLKQFANVRSFIYNEDKQLYHHAYDESKSMFWCDPDTGLSPHVWGRAVGWFVMALVDVLELLEGEAQGAEGKALLQALLKETIDGMLPYQHSSGMWYQIPDHAGEADNYLETSGTLMLSYAMCKGVRLGLLPENMMSRGVAAFEGTVHKYLREVDGQVRLGGICKSAGLGTHPDTGVVRDGSYAYYIHGEKIVENNGHGVAPLLMAYNEIMLLHSRGA